MRITGGKYRSRILEAPRGDATRPTSDRVREALFGILGSSMSFAEARILDVYAGTGALAFESLSRGAASAVLVESRREAVRAIDGNARTLGVLASIHVVATPVERALSVLEGRAPFDLIFADPPYADVSNGVAVRALGELMRSGGRMLAEGGRFVVEHAKSDPPPEIAGLTLLDSRRYGDTTLSF